jgi:hypothetical protein
LHQTHRSSLSDIVHQVPQAILEQLDLDDFELDESNLSIKVLPSRAYADVAAEADVEAMPPTDE